jgi:hypothetical protein
MTGQPPRSSQELSRQLERAWALAYLAGWAQPWAGDSGAPPAELVRPPQQRPSDEQASLSSLRRLVRPRSPREGSRPTYP